MPLFSMTSLVWFITTHNAIGTGIHLTYFGVTYLEAVQLHQAEIILILSGTAKAALAGSQEDLDTTIFCPQLMTPLTT